jgi:hypothetical protein
MTTVRFPLLPTLRKVARTIYSDPISLAEAAWRLRIRWHTLRHACVRGDVDARQVEGRWVVNAADLPRVKKEQPWAPWAIRKFAINERTGRKPKRRAV